MTNMRNYLAWLQQNQQNNPEWKAANAWQNRNQAPQKAEPKPEDRDEEVIEENPED